ncbi:acyl-CoA dehydrogenase family protein [Mycolicibacterium sp. XJ870]
MTILDPEAPGAAGTAVMHDHADPTLVALRRVLFSDRHAMYRRVCDSVLTLNDDFESGLTYAENAARGPRLLRPAIAGLGGSSSALVSDAWLRGEVCSAAAVAAPRFLRVFSGHFSLATSAVLRLGNGTPYQRHLLGKLETGTALGVFAHTELGGTNGTDVRTQAIVNRHSRSIRLHTPDLAAAKFMPNVANFSDGVPRIVVVTARLLIDGRDEGVFAFVLELATSEGMADGVDVVALPDKAGAEMDHGLIALDLELPVDALLGGDWARIDEAGNALCELSLRQRFHRTISVLSSGRVDLPNAAVATARAALAMLVHWAQRRRPIGGIRMADRDLVQRDFVSAAATVYATTVFGAAVVEATIADTEPDQPSGAWAMLAKPLLSYNAFDVLQMCRQRSAARGALRNNYLADWISNCEGTITAEGENQIMWVTAGGFPRRVAQGRAPVELDITQLRIPGVPAERQWWHEMLAQRADIMGVDAREGRAAHAFGQDSAAFDLAAATAERLAADSMLAAAHRVADEPARELVLDLAAVWALERIAAQSLWYTQHGLMSSPRATLVDQELTRRRKALANDLPLLTAAFDIPALSAPLLAEDEIDAWRQYAGWADKFPATK